MYYYDPNRNDARRWAAVAAALYALLLAAAFLFVSFDLGLDRIVPGEGILVDFGTTETGLGERDPRNADVQAPARSAAAATEVQPVEYETDERSEVAVQTPNPERRRPWPEQPADERPRTGAAAEPSAEKPREVDRRALFPGRTAGSTAASEGTSQGAGNAGDPSGAPEGSHEGTGQGSAGIAYDLSGRSVAGRLPEPLYPGNESGKVIVDVEVDASGRVIRASHRAKGSTTGSTELIEAAVSAAYKARFSQSEAVIQHGTITYVFKLNG